MTEDVLVTIKGLALADSEDDEAVEVINIGKYNEVNGKCYVRYEECVEGEKETINNLLKFTDESVEITRKGPSSTHMVFEKDNKTMTYYNTPYGSLFLGIYTREITIERSEELISIAIDYTLEANYEVVADYNVDILISNKNRKVNLYNGK